MKITKEVKIGFTAVLALIIIYSGMIFLKGLKIFNTEDKYYVEMSDVQGLPVGADVMARGMKVGYVRDINYNSAKNNLVVTINVSPNIELPVGTEASLEKEMLGTMRMILNLSDQATIIASGDTIKAIESVGLLDQAANMVPQVEAMLPKLDSILAALNALSNDPALANALHNIEKVSADLTTTTNCVNSLLARDVPSIMKKADNTLANLETTTYNFSKIDLNGIATKADNTLGNLQAMTFKLNTAMESKDNSLGMLMNDNSIALHLDSTVINSSLLLEDLRLNPKRYVHFSLFGRKDK